jgi:hypothetical protein
VLPAIAPVESRAFTSSAPGARRVNADDKRIINGDTEALRFELPAGVWFLHIDTGGGDCLNRQLNDAETLAQGSLWLASAAPA